MPDGPCVFGVKLERVLICLKRLVVTLELLQQGAQSAIETGVLRVFRNRLAVRLNRLLDAIQPCQLGRQQRQMLHPMFGDHLFEERNQVVRAVCRAEHFYHVGKRQHVESLAQRHLAIDLCRLVNLVQLAVHRGGAQQRNLVGGVATQHLLIERERLLKLLLALHDSRFAQQRGDLAGRFAQQRVVNLKRFGLAPIPTQEPCVLAAQVGVLRVLLKQFLILSIRQLKLLTALVNGGNQHRRAVVIGKVLFPAAQKRQNLLIVFALRLKHLILPLIRPLIPGEEFQNLAEILACLAVVLEAQLANGNLGQNIPVDRLVAPEQLNGSAEIVLCRLPFFLTHQQHACAHQRLRVARVDLC
ncbi:hypothetical protein HRbin14_02274 [bacterium HR14]|nr:hypothetical protein HRbin14_02274 [bacterium HR14]